MTERKWRLGQAPSDRDLKTQARLLFDYAEAVQVAAGYRSDPEMPKVMRVAALMMVWAAKLGVEHDDSA